MLGRLYGLIGDAELAREQYRAALAARPADIVLLRAAAELTIAAGPVREAEGYLLRIIEKKSAAPAQAAWARRALALLLASTGDPRQSVKSLELLGLTDEGVNYRPSANEPIEELRAKATVLALHQNRATKLSAIELLREIIDREPNAFADRDLLMRLYDEQGNWSEARKQMQALVTTEGTRPVYLAHAITSLLRQGALEEAESLLARLEKIEPQSDLTVEIKARVLKAKGNSKDAVALLLNLIRQQPAKAGTAALLLEQIGEFVAAENAYRIYSAQSRGPEPYLPLASFLARQNRISEAIDLCERAWPSSSRPQAVTEAMVAMLYSSSIDTAQCRRAAKLVKQALDKNPNDAALLFHLGNIRFLQGDYQEAERLYNGSIEANQTNSGPLANLAWLLARRDGAGKQGTRARCSRCQAGWLGSRPARRPGPRLHGVGSKRTRHQGLAGCPRTEPHCAQVPASRAGLPDG